MLVLHYLIMLSDWIIKEQATVCSVFSFPATGLSDAGSCFARLKGNSPWIQWCEQSLPIGGKGFNFYL